MFDECRSLLRCVDVCIIGAVCEVLRCDAAVDGEEDVAEAYNRENMRVVKVGWVLDEGWLEDMVAAICFCFRRP